MNSPNEMANVNRGRRLKGSRFCPVLDFAAEDVPMNICHTEMTCSAENGHGPLNDGLPGRWKDMLTFYGLRN